MKYLFAHCTKMSFMKSISRFKVAFLLVATILGAVMSVFGVSKTSNHLGTITTTSYYANFEMESVFSTYTWLDVTQTVNGAVYNGRFVGTESFCSDHCTVDP